MEMVKHESRERRVSMEISASIRMLRRNISFFFSLFNNSNKHRIFKSRLDLFINEGKKPFHSIARTKKMFEQIDFTRNNFEQQQQRYWIANNFNYSQRSVFNFIMYASNANRFQAISV